MTTHGSRPILLPLPRSYFKIDRYGVFLAVLLVGTTLGAAIVTDILFIDTVTDTDTITDRSTAEQAAAGGGLVIAEVILAVTILALVLLYRRIPAFLRELSRDVVKIGTLLAVGGYLAADVGGFTGQFLTVITVLLAVYVGYRVIDHVGLWWVVNNLMGIGFTIVAGAALGYVFGIWFLVVFLVGMSIYDHYFANKKRYMFELAVPLIRARLPVIIIYPTVWRLQWDQFIDSVTAIGDGEEDDEDDWIVGGLGMADCLLPAGFAAALVAYAGGPAIGSLPLAAVGVVVAMGFCGFYLRASMDRNGSGAGMPPITTAAFVGGGVFWFIGLVLGVVA